MFSGTIRDNIAYIGHFHTGGVPGRHELDAKQELNWRAIATAIAIATATGGTAAIVAIGIAVAAMIADAITAVIARAGSAGTNGAVGAV